MWQVAVELPEDFSAASEILVSQNGQPLEAMRFGENRWLLKSLAGSIEAEEARNGNHHWRLDLGDKRFWLFKLLAESEKEEGHLVGAATRGDYLLIMPDDWSRSVCSGVELRRVTLVVAGVSAKVFMPNLNSLDPTASERIFHFALFVSICQATLPTQFLERTNPRSFSAQLLSFVRSMRKHGLMSKRLFCVVREKVTKTLWPVSRLRQ
jgi:hypothetical protein